MRYSVIGGPENQTIHVTCIENELSSRYMHHKRLKSIMSYPKFADLIVIDNECDQLYQVRRSSNGYIRWCFNKLTNNNWCLKQWRVLASDNPILSLTNNNHTKDPNDNNNFPDLTIETKFLINSRVRYSTMIVLDYHAFHIRLEQVLKKRSPCLRQILLEFGFQREHLDIFDRQLSAREVNQLGELAAGRTDRLCGAFQMTSFAQRESARYSSRATHVSCFLTWTRRRRLSAQLLSTKRRTRVHQGYRSSENCHPQHTQKRGNR